ncbi:hypothetical protein BDV06DRAFT_223730 [Aspergillus oleicola]
MKLVSIVLAATAATTVQAGPMNKWCMFPGEICGKSKRAFDAIDNVKRSADAVAEAMAFLDDLADQDYAQITDAKISYLKALGSRLQNPDKI